MWELKKNPWKSRLKRYSDFFMKLPKLSYLACVLTCRKGEREIVDMLEGSGLVVGCRYLNYRKKSSVLSLLPAW